MSRLTLQVLNLLIDNLNEEQRTAVFQLQVQRCFGAVPGAEGDNGMVGPICSPAIAEQIWQSASILHVGQGYW